MDLIPSEEEEAFRAEARAWLRANVPGPLPSADTREGFARHVEWERRLGDARWAAVAWPEAHGGRGATLWEWLIFEEEYHRAGAPQRVTQEGLSGLGPLLFAFGTDAQQAHHLPRIAAATDLWCRGWSEPEAGSDLAGVTSGAERDEAAGGWRLTGAKTWVTRGACCTHLFGLFRTDPTVERHRGLTCFLIPLDADGVEVRAVARFDGDEAFAEISLEDVAVPDDAVLGGVGDGWRVALSPTSSVRGLALHGPARFTAAADRLVDLYRRVGAHADPELRDAVTRAWIDAEAYRLAALADATDIVDGRTVSRAALNRAALNRAALNRAAMNRAAMNRAAMNKVWWSELDVRIHETALALLGPRAELVHGSDGAVDGGGWMKAFQLALGGPIQGGTNEVQRNVIAERVLGLPRA